MLDACLGDVSLETFRRSYLSRTPFAKPSTLVGRPLLDWDTVDHVLRSPHRDVLVVAAGQLIDWKPPNDLAELRTYLAIGVGLCIRNAEHCHPSLRRVADQFENSLGEAHVQVFVTPGGCHGFGWHYDDEHVFIGQTVGVKDYYFRANTIAPDVPANSAAFAAFARETSLLCTAHLVAGDFLYLPARWWHRALCREDALSISVGVSPARPLQL
jgi:50S ribosomal protein L16 3-hydroxylase